jgi:predicted DNA binding protein
MVLTSVQFDCILARLPEVLPEKNKRLQFQRYLLTYPSDIDAEEYIQWIKTNKSKSINNKPLRLEVYPTTDKTGDVSIVFWKCSNRSSIIGERYFHYHGLAPKIQIVRDKDTWDSLLQYIDRRT